MEGEGGSGSPLSEWEGWPQTGLPNLTREWRCPGAGPLPQPPGWEVQAGRPQAACGPRHRGGCFRTRLTRKAERPPLAHAKVTLPTLRL